MTTESIQLDADIISLTPDKAMTDGIINEVLDALADVLTTD